MSGLLVAIYLCMASVILSLYSIAWISALVSGRGSLMLHILSFFLSVFMLMHMVLLAGRVEVDMVGMEKVRSSRGRGKSNRVER